MIHPAGRKLIAISIFSYLIAFSLILIITRFNPNISLGLGVLGIILISFLLFFFRNPIRKINSDNSLIFAPADGKIVDISIAYENEFLKKDCLKVSIFMSMLNVHVNRYPLSGFITYSHYHPGRYLIANHPKSSELNEHHSFAIETPEGISILMKQIAGIVARRVVSYAKVGEQAIQGNDVGFIKFGSRVDLFLPLNNSEILVKMNDKVKGNRTVIARLKNTF
jgi:phosphatidylserine decarboxylase